MGHKPFKHKSHAFLDHNHTLWFQYVYYIRHHEELERKRLHASNFRLKLSDILAHNACVFIAIPIMFLINPVLPPHQNTLQSAIDNRSI